MSWRSPWHDIVTHDMSFFHARSGSVDSLADGLLPCSPSSSARPCATPTSARSRGSPAHALGNYVKQKSISLRRQQLTPILVVCLAAFTLGYLTVRAVFSLPHCVDGLVQLRALISLWLVAT